MNPDPTSLTGPLGSTVHVLQADADTVAALAAVDWNRHFRRVCLDPARGLITLTSPSRLHEDLTTMFGDIRGTLLPSTARVGDGCLTQANHPPGNPGRFNFPWTDFPLRNVSVSLNLPAAGRGVRAV